MLDVEHEPRQLAVGAGLMLLTAVIQTFGVVLLEELVARLRDVVEKEMTRLRMLGMLCGIIVYLFALHILEMALWAAFFRPMAGYRTYAIALYESALAFTTMDIAELPPAWKFLSACEGVTGLLMFAWSTSILFDQTSWMTKARRAYLAKHHLFGVREHKEEPES